MPARAAACLLLLATPLAPVAAAPAALPPALIVFFPDWSGGLDDAANAVIRRAADAAAAAPRTTLTITGYADRKGSDAANVFLTRLRAQRVEDALVADGVAVARIRMVAAGAQPRTGLMDRRAEIAFSGSR